MSLPDAVARDVMVLCTTEEFKTLWAYIEQLDENWKSEIVDVNTEPEQRERLVQVRQTLVEEVLSIPERAQKKINQKDKP